MTQAIASDSLQTQETNTLKGPEFFGDSGILIVDKPAGISSMDVIRELRKVVRFRRCGHGGTLDPFATGVLPILFNGATRLSDKVMSGKKVYEGVLYLGLSYDTQDMTGTPLHAENPIPADLKLEDLQKETKAFEGKILQRPPAYSAVKRKGRPLYDYARAGETIEVEPREVFVESFEILERLDERRFRFQVRSAKGVYIRTLVHDLGQILGCGAVLQSLRRLQTGNFSIDEAVQLETLKVGSDIRLHLKGIGAV